MNSQEDKKAPMANPFASPKQPSLFPTTIPVVDISKHEYRLFYKYERALLRTFLLLLHLEVVEATLVIAFLLWLERGGYTSYPLGKIFVDTLTTKEIKEVVDEVLVCIKFLQRKANNLMSEGSSNSYNVNITHLQCFLDRKHINLDDLYHYGDLISDEVYCIASDVSVKAFDDILEQFINHGKTIAMQPHRDANVVANGVSGLRYNGPVVGANQDTKFIQNYPMSHKYKQHQHEMVAKCTYLGQNQGYVGSQMFINYGRLVEREPDEEVPPHDRTIFLTFSKGYPLSENEITDYFCRMYGDIVQSIHMQTVEAGTQPLYARIVVRDPSSVKAVTERDGPSGKSKYVIKGKHVWARKFIPRTP